MSHPYAPHVTAGNLNSARGGTGASKTGAASVQGDGGGAPPMSARGTLPTPRGGGVKKLKVLI